MIYEYDKKIEELLNGFIDGELTPQQLAEVQQLVRKDKGVARRLTELQRCRLLVSSLPPAEPPAEVVAGIKQAVKSRTAPLRTKIESPRGARHLFVRQLLAASVIVGLFGILAAVIFQIAAPTESHRPVVAVAPQESSVGIYSLQLQTPDFTGVDAFIKKLLDDSSWLKVEAKQHSTDRSTYRVLCSRAALETLMSDLTPVWPKFDSAKLVVHTQDLGRAVEVDSITPDQITDIARQDNDDQRTRLAQDFATLNSVNRALPEQKQTENSPEMLTIPKPVLTSGEKNPSPAPEGAFDQISIDLSIVVSSHK
jgi:hypothetical protein